MSAKEKLLNPDARGPLKGLLVVDFTRWVAGPYCTNMLSDMGATVIKVESFTGDNARSQIGGNPAAFHTYNHGKKSIAIKMEDPEGREIIYNLVREADVVVENFRDGLADKIGIGYKELSRINKNIVYLSMPAWGSSPPEYAGKPGVDILVQSMSGVMSINGMPDGPPCPVGVPIVDQSGAAFGYAAILSALYHRAMTGLGQHVSVALIDVMVFNLSTRFAEYIGTGKIPQRLGNAHAAIVTFQSFETADGWVTVAALTEAQWKDLCKALGADELLLNPRYASSQLRLENRTELTAKLREYFLQKSSQEWADIFTKAKVMFAPIWNIKEVISSDIVQDHGYVPTVTHPVEGSYPVLQTPLNLSQTPGKVQGPAPLLGEHTEEILSALGYQGDTIKTLAERKLIKS